MDVSRARASLVVLSSRISGAEIAERLGLAGDQQWEAGDPVRPGSKSRQRFGGWALDSRVNRSSGAASHIEDLLRRVSHLANPLSALKAMGEIDSSRVWLHLDAPEVGFALEPDVLRLVSELGSLEVDIYS
jgi:hypothetical protein